MLMRIVDAMMAAPPAYCNGDYNSARKRCFNLVLALAIAQDSRLQADPRSSHLEYGVC